jgi:hypothetical protein
MKKEASQKIIEEKHEPMKDVDGKSVSEVVRGENLFSDSD